MTISPDLDLRAPFPWYGGKRRVAGEVWGYLGTIGRYVEPFAGSLGVLFGRPGGAPATGLEIVNDADGYIVNVWRSLKHSPAKAIAHADDLRSEYDLTARHLWLVNEGRDRLAAGLQSDPHWHDPLVAGWWLYGVALWIGGGFASGTGPWTRSALEGSAVVDDERGVHRKLPFAGNDGRGVHRQLPFAGNDGRGVYRQLGDASDAGSVMPGVYALAERLSARLARVLVTNGDWERVLTPAVTGASSGATGIYLDPPYRDHGDTYNDHGDVEDLWNRVQAFADTTRHRVVISGYEGDLSPPVGWRVAPYTARGTSSANRTREVFWISPSCLGLTLFDT